MAWCNEHDCPYSACDSYHLASESRERAEANQNSTEVWRRRAYDLKRRLDALQGGSAEWIEKVHP